MTTKQKTTAILDLTHARTQKLWLYLIETAQNGVVFVVEDYDGEWHIKDTFNEVEYTGKSLAEAVDNLPTKTRETS